MSTRRPMGRPLATADENALEDLIERETGDLQDLIGVLEDELDALAAGSVAEVERCTQAKQQLIRRVFSARDAVNAMARTHAGSAMTAEAWIAGLESARVRSAFDRLTELAGDARELNQLAARVVHHKLAGVNERLDLLAPSGRSPALYQSGGMVDGAIAAKGIIGRA